MTKQEQRKRAWVKPQLIVLVRGRPEENVLLGCKYISQAGPLGQPCEACSADAPS